MSHEVMLHGGGFAAGFDRDSGGLASLNGPWGRLGLVDRGVAVTVNGDEFTTLSAQPSRVSFTDRSAEQSFTFPQFTLTLTTTLAAGDEALSRRIALRSRSGVRLEIASRTFLDVEFRADGITFVKHKVWASWLTALFARSSSGCFLAMFDHPFGVAEVNGARLALSEKTMARLAPGQTLDEGALHLAPTSLTGRMVSQAPVDELDYAYSDSWQPSVRKPVGKSWWSRGESDLDEGEVAAARALVESLVPWEKGRVTSCHVPWCENDFEFDITTQDGEDTYARMLDLLEEIGCRSTILTPGGGDAVKRPDGGWQHVMWLGLGAMVAEREWTPDTPLPPRVQRILDLAKSKGIGILAYVNPAYKFGADKGHWLRMRDDGARQTECCYACEECRGWLVKTLIDFKNAYGLAGYCLDFIGEHHPCYDPDHDHVPGENTHLVGWRAFQSITRALNDADPDIIIDGRLCTYRFAPFSTAGITYPHPFICDEQPNHMTAWPDLSMNRVFANFQRRVAYWGRNRFFVPNYKLPGFMTHQQSRTFRWKHSWDRVGWKYNVLSSIAVSGINNVINYLPVREMDEYEAFSVEDGQWFRHWLKWAEENGELLLGTRDIFGEPAPERVDGTAACTDGRGVIFLVNPNYRAKHVQLTIGDQIGLSGADHWQMTELSPSPGDSLGCVRQNEAIMLTVPPHQVLAIELTPGMGPCYQGRRQDWMDAEIDGWRLADGSPVPLPYEFTQAPGWQVDVVDTATKPTHWVSFECDWTPDERIKEKLASQRTPLKLEDHEAVQPYLDPGRLLVSFAFRFPENVVQATMKVNGEPVPVETCYLGSSWRAVEQEYRERNICGLYADLDGRIEFGRSNLLEVEFAHYGPCEWVGAFVENL